MATPLELVAVAIRPEPADNVAIVTRDLEPGTVIRHGDTAFTVRHRVLEGHRVVVDPDSGRRAATVLVHPVRPRPRRPGAGGLRLHRDQPGRAAQPRGARPAS